MRGSAFASPSTLHPPPTLEASRLPAGVIAAAALPDAGVQCRGISGRGSIIQSKPSLLIPIRGDPKLGRFVVLFASPVSLEQQHAAIARNGRRDGTWRVPPSGVTAAAANDADAS